MPDAPLCTIGITCFNARDTVERALLSALAQNYSNLEIIIVDDCSTDGSAELVEKHTAGDARTRLLRHDTNLGPAGARNSILGAAGGEFVAFFDDDDEARPNRISSQIGALTMYEAQSGARLVACYAGGERLYGSGYVKPLPAIGSQAIVPNGPGLANYLLFFGRQPGWFYGSGTPTAALLARKSTFTAVGGFDQSLRRVEDADFAIRLALTGGHFVGTAESLFMQHSTVASDKSPERNRDAEIAIAQKQRPYLDSINRTYYATHWPQLRYWHFKRNYGRLALAFLGIFLHNPVAATRHFVQTGPARLRHEAQIRKGAV